MEKDRKIVLRSNGNFMNNNYISNNNEETKFEDLTKEEQELLLHMTLQVLAEAGEPLTFNQIQERVEKLIDELPIEE